MPHLGRVPHPSPPVPDSRPGTCLLTLKWISRHLERKLLTSHMRAVLGHSKRRDVRCTRCLQVKLVCRPTCLPAPIPVQSTPRNQSRAKQPAGAQASCRSDCSSSVGLKSTRNKEVATRAQRQLRLINVCLNSPLTWCCYICGTLHTRCIVRHYVSLCWLM